MKIYPFKRQFIVYFCWVIGFSLLATALVWGGFLWMLNQGKLDWLRPANHYEKKVPSIRRMVEEEGERLLQQQGAAALERLIDRNGMSYAVVDRHGRYLYGTLTDPQIDGRRELIRLLNSTSTQKLGQVHTVMPIIDKAGGVEGAVIVAYILKAGVSPDAKNSFAAVIILMVLVMPFIIVILFTWLFGRRFGRKLNQPIQALIEGTRRVQRRDLDFSFSYEGASEITQLMKAFDEMRRELSLSLQREWRLEQERRDMVAALAHDLRTPLAIVQGHVEGLLEGGMKNPERLERYLWTIDKNTKRAARLVQDMNRVAEMEVPQFRLNLHEVNVRVFVEEKASDIERLCEERNIEFRCSLTGKEADHQRAMLDADKVSELLDNVVSNSLRYTPPGGTIVWETECAQDKVMLTVTDTGPGFPPDMMKAVFDKFVQGDAARSRNKGHAGLGLYMAKLIAEKHGGRIYASNRPEGGACVTVTLPRAG
ncbi:HAMP domain-containing histidine kinase [Paenibacillus thiaminolyticus]|uniref:histidine kinase n=1 Tax=Paenibacillus thiaminolyticus TaxID=49283 RepID=A0AAP9J416_PANTH|nr:HAMP domain-containing sensor histidine kinase [Paenibacillus thiaminolyticus]MCY9538358.1 HAMP domain-containing histidine kinase [Paenibacillus thiaminolyticus]MCY9602735.1 HAMP domain-containing histidine kinase [Paenibacillus thiaminolyticus]MCY9610855.1 HAMP domain-containing histidine kinase [Paenibacillus thiaminolyticus]MCY9616091.1 HAMP domain-containing histidine kinase [Paenibacillus thiaminolyticus]MCY9621374.1 HAMP domain-containing histidine kinase [Paenibacillus thiaminolytic